MGVDCEAHEFRACMPTESQAVYHSVHSYQLCRICHRALPKVALGDCKWLRVTKRGHQ